MLPYYIMGKRKTQHQKIFVAAIRRNVPTHSVTETQDSADTGRAVLREKTESSPSTLYIFNDRFKLIRPDEHKVEFF